MLEARDRVAACPHGRVGDVVVAQLQAVFPAIRKLEVDIYSCETSDASKVDLQPCVRGSSCRTAIYDGSGPSRSRVAVNRKACVVAGIVAAAGRCDLGKSNIGRGWR